MNLGEESLGMRLLLFRYIPKNTSQFYSFSGTFCLPLLGIANYLCSLAICHLYPCECDQLVMLLHYDNQKIHANKSIKKKFKIDVGMKCQKASKQGVGIDTKLNVHSPIPTSFSHANCNVNKLQNLLMSYLHDTYLYLL